MTEQENVKVPTQDIEIAYLENSFRDAEVEKSSDKQMKIGKDIQTILEETEYPEVISFGISGIIKTHTLEDYNPLLVPWALMNRALDECIEGDVLYEKPGIAEETVIQNLKENPKISIKYIEKIVDGMGKRDPSRRKAFLIRLLDMMNKEDGITYLLEDYLF